MEKIRTLLVTGTESEFNDEMELVWDNLLKDFEIKDIKFSSTLNYAEKIIYSALIIYIEGK